MEGTSSEENNAWVSHVQERFKSKKYKMQELSSCVCIYRVPELLIGRKREAYRPKFVSFGPFHHKKHQGLSAMEDHKLEAVQKTLERLTESDSINSIEDLIAEVQKSDKKIRDCYEDFLIEHDEKTLAWMMTMDGCFILEFLRAVYAEGKRDSTLSLIFKRIEVDNIIQSSILNDILKLENQIPLFILITILKLECQTDHQALSKLMKILHRCLVFQCYPFKTDEHKCADIAKNCARKLLLQKDTGACHLLDLCREMIEDLLTPATTAETCPQKCVLCCTFSCDLSSCLGSSSGRTWQTGHHYEMPRAELLHNAGIQFKTSAGNIRFEKRNLGRSTLLLPPIVIEENKTETKLRNLIIFEEYEKMKKKKNVISNYIGFMNKLIDSEKDVALLSKEGIIINWLGSDKKVADLFNNLDNETIIEGIEQFKEVARQVNVEYNRKPKVLMREFMEVYCSKPWYIVSLVAGILILAMTAIQTVYSVKKS